MNLRHKSFLAVMGDIDQERLSTQQELVEELLSIVHEFSCRLSGRLRRYETMQRDELTGGA